MKKNVPHKVIQRTLCGMFFCFLYRECAYGNSLQKQYHISQSSYSTSYTNVYKFNTASMAAISSLVKSSFAMQAALSRICSFLLAPVITVVTAL